jgi:TolA-binding protein
MRIFALLVFSLSLWAQEPSAFGAGDLDSDNPYGLTASEKAVHKNAQDIKKLQNSMYQMESKLDSVSERVEGIRSVFQGELGKLAESRGQSGVASDRLSDVNSSISSLQSELDSFKAQYEQNIKEQNANIAKINIVLQELSSIIDNINQRYVSKDELAQKPAKKESSQKANSSKFDPKNNYVLFDEALDMLGKGELDKAKERFEFTSEHHYKPAGSAYYLGEIAYKQKKYKDAIYYYKSSASRYNEADYMPNLLLNLSRSLIEVNDKKNADTFLKNLIETYPQSSEAKEAEKILNS